MSKDRQERPITVTGGKRWIRLCFLLAASALTHAASPAHSKEVSQRTASDAAATQQQAQQQTQQQAQQTQSGITAMDDWEEPAKKSARQAQKGSKRLRGNRRHQPK